MSSGLPPPLVVEEAEPRCAEDTLRCGVPGAGASLEPPLAREVVDPYHPAQRIRDVTGHLVAAAGHRSCGRRHR